MPTRNQTRTHYRCAKCRRVLRNDLFVAAPRLRRENKLYPYCKSCRTDATRRYTQSPNAERREQRRKQLTYEIGKLITPRCVCCGFDKHPAAIELHHLDMEAKETQIAIVVALFTKGRNPKYAEEIRREADKCVPLCANCHRLLHQGVIDLEIQFPVPPWSVDDLMGAANRIWQTYESQDNDSK